MNAQMSQPQLKITVQPIEQFHFRYDTEMNEKHGSLTGQQKKTFPSVCLRNFYGKASILCSLYQMPKSNKMPVPHSHSLLLWNGNAYKKDPHEVIVSPVHGYEASFKGMTIMNQKREFIEDELFEKLVRKSEFVCGQKLTLNENVILRTEAKRHASNVDLNQVKLCFEAYSWNNDHWVQLCQPVFSTPINETRNAQYGPLKICRISTVAGSASGNDDVFLFVQKVDKKIIGVRFYEEDDNGKVIWAKQGTDIYVHYQHGIAVKTPAYKDIDIKENVNVFIQLYRSTDKATSEPVEFRYKPCKPYRKRPRISSLSHDSNVPAVVDKSAQYCPPAAVTAANEVHDDIELVLSELGNVEHDAEAFKRLINELKRLGRNSTEYDMVVKDSVCDATDNGEMAPEELRKIEKFVLKFLEFPLLERFTTDTERIFHVGRNLFVYIFERAIFNDDDDTIIHVCVKSNDFTLMERLLKILHNFKLNELLNWTNNSQETGVHVACAMNKVNVLQKLIEYDANVNVIDSNSNTPLHVAIQNGNDDCVSTLLSAKSIDIDLNVFNDYGWTPLHLAAMKNSLNAIKMLNRRAAKSIFEDVDRRHGDTALHIALQSNAYDVAEYLIQNKCISPFKTNRSGRMALYLARTANAMHLIDLMEQCKTVQDEQLMDNDDNDASSEESFESQETNKTDSSNATVESISAIDKLTISNDDKFYTELSDIFNKNGKWKFIVNELGYQKYLENWQQSRNPTKTVLLFAKTLKVSTDELEKIFDKLGEKRAIQCIHEWENSV